MEDNREAEQIKPTQFSAKAPARMGGAESERSFCGPVLDGTAGSGCEPGDGVAQQLIWPPQWQQA
jgi:hypothetical protein